MRHVARLDALEQQVAAPAPPRPAASSRVSVTPGVAGGVPPPAGGVAGAVAAARGRAPAGGGRAWSACCLTVPDAVLTVIRTLVA